MLRRQQRHASECVGLCMNEGGQVCGGGGGISGVGVWRMEMVCLLMQSVVEGVCGCRGGGTTAFAGGIGCGGW